MLNAHTTIQNKSVETNHCYHGTRKPQHSTHFNTHVSAIDRKLHWDERGGVKTKHGAKYPVNQDKPRRYIGIYRMR